MHIFLTAESKDGTDILLLLILDTGVPGAVYISQLKTPVLVEQDGSIKEAFQRCTHAQDGLSHYYMSSYRHATLSEVYAC